MSLLCVYAVLSEAPVAAPGRGVCGEPIRLVRCSDLLAAVGDVPDRPVIDATSIRAHDAIVRWFCRGAEAVLPVRFGTLFEDDDGLVRALSARRDALGRALTLVRGREQMTLRLYGERVGQECDAGDDGSDATTGLGTRYLTRRWQAHRRRHGTPKIAGLQQRLDGLVAAERVERLAAGTLLASIHHLIPVGRSDAYLAAVAGAAPTLEPVRVRPSGPWPPYAFAPGAIA